MTRVLKPGGGMFILEFSKTSPGLWGALYNFYFRHVLPLIGRIISRDKHAYTYLPQSVGEFVSGDEFLAVLRGAGLSQGAKRELTGGVATIYSAYKKPEESWQ